MTVDIADRRPYREAMDDGPGARVSVDLTSDEARLVIEALRQFEPFWPSGTDASTRSDRLADIRLAIDHVTASLSS